MKSKKYEIRGMKECVVAIPAGRSRIQIAFTGGHLAAGGITPAAFETSDTAVQALIEKSPQFKQHIIRLRG